MKKIVLISILTVCSFISLKAQDVILMKDNSIITSVVKEIGDDYIVYKAFDNQSGPDHKVALSKVLKIRYQNGTEEIFSAFQDGPTEIVEVMQRRGMGLSLNGRKLLDGEVESIIGSKIYRETYLSAKSQLNTANTLLMAGTLCVVGGFALAVLGDSYNSGPDIGALILVAGGICLEASIPFGVIGSSRMKWIASDYNERYSNYHANLKIGTQKHGFGIALNF